MMSATDENEEPGMSDPHAALLARHRAVMPSWLSLYYDEPIEIVSGHGRRVTDAAGRSYLDFFAGILTNMVGYDVAEIREAVERQVSRGVYTVPRCT